ncbi:MAG: hypothetical protein JSV10_09830 [Candidatus Zixiibacteriota bacterium]|nr:MAG: hypothetical protein JSV10_09830 [candidate division Zixibacteria bacterium]
MLKNLLIGMAVLGFVLGTSILAMSDNIATQSVSYEVSAINEIEVSGDPGALVVNTATAGSEPNAATDATTTWDITTNGGTDAKKLTGATDTDMPANTTLEINLTAPTGATSPGDVTLSATAADLVTLIDSVAESGLSITYTLSATVAAGVVTAASKTVTLTLTDT